MRIIFFGTPAISATILDMLQSEHDVVAAYTRPDAIRGRGKTALPTEVKALCEDAGIPVFTPLKVSDLVVVDQIKEFAPDVICVVAYGALIPSTILNIPPFGCLNVHTSLLPRWRGAAPIERAILAGDEFTGVSIMKMEEGLDTGPYAAVEIIPVNQEDVVSLESKLAILGGKALLKVLEQLSAGHVEWTPQADEGLIYAEKIQKGELFIKPDDTALTIDRKVRASSGAHPSKMKIADKGVTLEEVKLVQDDDLLATFEALSPGEVLFSHKHLVLATDEGFIEIVRLKPDGKKSMDAQSFSAGIPNIKNSHTRWGSYE